MHTTNTVHMRFTAFGPFEEVVNNPSDQIMKRIVELHREARAPLPYSIEDATTLDVSSAGIREYFSRPLSVVPSVGAAKESATLLFVHLGVHRAAKGAIRLETQCYNEAHFPDGDVRGCHCDHQPIECPPDASPQQKSEYCQRIRRTNLPSLEVILDKIAQKQLPIVATDDPGRYLCNYCYYSSLMTSTAATTAHRKVCSVFFHVLDPSELPIEVQARVITEALAIFSEVLNPP